MSEVTEKYGGGEEGIWEQLKEGWAVLRERMRDDDGSGERESSASVVKGMETLTVAATYLDFHDASNVKWIQASSPEKYERLLKLYDDDTFTKLMKKVERYEAY